MPNYIRTYEELTELSSAVRTHLSTRDAEVLLTRLSSEDVMFWMGCKFFEIDLYYPDKNFRSNRYFLDAIGMRLLPDLLHVREIESTILSTPNLKGELERIYSICLNAATLAEISSFSLFDLDSFYERGYAILENVIDTDFCDELAELVTHHARVELLSDKGGYVYGDGQMQRVYNLVTRGRHFRDLLENALIHKIMSQIFHRDNHHSKYYLTSFHANILKPGAAAQIWHIDANVPEPLPDWNIRVNANFVTQDYTRCNGATEVVPGSHRWLRKPTADQLHCAHSEAVPLEAPKGAIIIWHGYLWHRSGENRSINNRIALLSTYAAGFLREVCLEENVYLSSSPSVQSSFSSRTKRILGWNHGLKDYGG